MDLLSFNIKDSFEGGKFQEALSWLPVDERPSVMRFKFDRDRHLALASRLIRRYYFSRLLNRHWSDLEFTILPGGKPSLKGCSLDFNLSHESHWVIFGCVKEGRIGVDAVSIDRSISNSIDEFIKSFEPQLSAQEMQLIKGSTDPLQTFFELWGLKESYIKALGVGLSFDLNRLNFYGQDNKIRLKINGEQACWSFHLSSLDADTLAAICYDRDSCIQQPSHLLGEPLQLSASLFHQIKFEEIRNVAQIN